MDSRISDFFSFENVLCLTGVSKNLFDLAIRITLHDKDAETIEKARDLMFAKESIITINFGNGFAVIHGRMEEISLIKTGIVVSREPMKFGRETPFRGLICLLVPSSAGKEYLDFLARISLAFSKPEAQRIFDCSSTSEILGVIHTLDEEILADS